VGADRLGRAEVAYLAGLAVVATAVSDGAAQKVEQGVDAQRQGVEVLHYRSHLAREKLSTASWRGSATVSLRKTASEGSAGLSGALRVGSDG
jgi:hypothetical protein